VTQSTSTKVGTLPKLDDGNFSGKRVLVRVDFNVPMDQNRHVLDDTRIVKSLPTLRYLSAQGARVIILTHRGRLKDADRAQSRVRHTLSLEPIAPLLSELLGQPVTFVPDCIGNEVTQAVAALSNGDVLLLENTRFYPGEEANDPEFIRALASLGDVYVNDAFSAAHRAHASTEGLAHCLPSYGGRALIAELSALEGVLKNPKRPVLAIIGGSKISTKIEILTNLVGQVDTLVVAGAMANTFLAAMGFPIGRSLYEPDHLETARQVIAQASHVGCNLILPQDVCVSLALEPHAQTRFCDLNNITAQERIGDIGPRSIAALEAQLAKCHTVLWNGPLGAFEIPPFDQGTVAIARRVAALTEEGALISVAGGGDTVAILNYAGMARRFSYVSTAGGAFLEWLEGRPLPGIEALRSR
jgi:phosphoglycerate kinase